jgi:SAM-dependent methyltransferase
LVIRPLLRFVRELLTSALLPGDIAVDATVGNGHDTLFLAERVGESGRVFGFDVQEAALLQAKRRLGDAGVLERVELMLLSHARMREAVPLELHGRVKAVTFNLGYLPGGDKSVVTKTESTIEALCAALEILAPGGVVTAMLYSGHPQGKEESRAVLGWAEQLDQSKVHVLLYRFLNQKNDPPVLVALEKRV